MLDSDLGFLVVVGCFWGRLEGCGFGKDMRCFELWDTVYPVLLRCSLDRDWPLNQILSPREIGAR